MKYKLCGFFLCSVILLLSLVAPFIESGRHTRYHQHLEAPVKTENKTGSSGFSTHLPLIKIDTRGAEIPGRAVYDENWNRSYTTAADGADRIRAHMDIVDHETTCNHAQDTPTISTEIEIHVRGRSSRNFDKSSYALRLITEDGRNNPQPVLGMDAHHEWVLHGPYLDQTLMRNYMWYNIGGELMDYAPNVRFCEIILNGKYQGVYVMLENLTAGKDGARLTLTVNAKRNTFSGYLLQLNGGWETDRDSTNQFSCYARRIPWQLEIVYPGAMNLTPEIIEGISKDFSDFEKALYSYDYDGKEGYKKYIDVQSFVDYFLIMELTCNYDAGAYSTYIGKETDGRLRMYLWDMNSACDNYQETPINMEGFLLHECPWYVMLVKDEDFTKAMISRYWELRETFFDLDYLYQYIDDVVTYLGDAAARNYSVWGYIFEEKNDLLQPAERNNHSYAESIEQLKSFLARRIAWLDENIDTLKQYSAESRVKKFKEATD